MIPFTRTVKDTETLSPTDEYFIVDANNAVADIYLPNIQTVATFDNLRHGFQTRSEKKLFYKISGRNVVRIIAQDGQLINGLPFYTALTATESGEITITSDTDWTLNTSGGGAVVVEYAGGHYFLKVDGGSVAPGAQIPLSTGEVLKNIARGIAPANTPFRARILIAGYYTINFNVSSDSQNTPIAFVGIAKNGTLVANGNTFKGYSTQANGQAVLSLIVGDEISLINTDTNPLQLPQDIFQICASMTITRFSPL